MQRQATYFEVEWNATLRHKIGTNEAIEFGTPQFHFIALGKFQLFGL
ncbi:MAG: hypothetical protein IAF94_16055 [Pirellulaceae bacterium]|nr:hypothetical protein [Pirellulaceae bacterium]